MEYSAGEKLLAGRGRAYAGGGGGGRRELFDIITVRRCAIAQMPARRLQLPKWQDDTESFARLPFIESLGT
jgi:hypothetical protein